MRRRKGLRRWAPTFRRRQRMRRRKGLRRWAPTLVLTSMFSPPPRPILHPAAVCRCARAAAAAAAKRRHWEALLVRQRAQRPRVPRVADAPGERGGCAAARAARHREPHLRGRHHFCLRERPPRGALHFKGEAVRRAGVRGVVLAAVRAGVAGRRDAAPREAVRGGRQRQPRVVRRARVKASSTAAPPGSSVAEASVGPLASCAGGSAPSSWA